MGAAAAPRKRRHVFRWVFLAIQVLFLVWVIAGAASTSNSGGDAHTQAIQYCSANWTGLYSSYADCVTSYGNTLNAAGDVGKGFGLGIVIALWVAADVILLAIWAIAVRPRWNRYEREQEMYQHTRPYDLAPNHPVFHQPGSGAGSAPGA